MSGCFDLIMSGCLNVDVSSPCPDCCDWDGNGSIFLNFGGECGLITVSAFFIQIEPNVWVSSGILDCGDEYSMTITCNPEIQYTGPESCDSKWSTSISIPCVDNLQITDTIYDCSCDTPPIWVFSGDGSDCICCTTTTTTTTPEPETSTTEFPWWEF